VLEQVARLGARLIIQTAAEAEVEEFLGRARHQRAAAVPEAREGSRNGYHPVTVKTTAGPVTIARPKLRNTSEAFASRLFGAGVTKTNALESLVIAGLVRGLSVRDVEATLADALGAEAALSKATVSRVCQAIKTEFETWSARRLDELVLDYLFLDASMFKMHPGARAEPVLAAWGITTAGKPVLVGLAPGRHGVHRRLERVPGRAARAGPAPAAAGHLRRRRRAAQRRRDRAGCLAASEVPDPLCRPADYADVAAVSLTCV
jgi:putative transposase